MRLIDLLRTSVERLEAGGIDDALADAEMIVFHAAGMERLDAYVDNPDVPANVSAKARRLLKRRLKGEPVQYIVGHVEFLGLTIRVGKGVLIPRPETELLVEEVIKTVTGSKVSVTANMEDSSAVARQASPAFLDLCTGSGCIALALAKKFPHAGVVGTDISKKALTYAQKNAGINSINNAVFLHGPLLEPLGKRTFDIITANPPYIRTDELETLQREIRDWEPVTALDGGKDGLDFYRMILASAPGHLKPGGFIFLELGFDQSEAVQRLAERAGFREIQVIADYAGINRILIAQR